MGKPSFLHIQPLKLLESLSSKRKKKKIFNRKNTKKTIVEKTFRRSKITFHFEKFKSLKQITEMCYLKTHRKKKTKEIQKTFRM